MTIFRHVLVAQLAVVLLTAPVQVRARTDSPQPPAEAATHDAGPGGKPKSSPSEPEANAGLCIIEAGGLTLRSDASTVFSVLEDEGGRTVTVSSGSIDFDLAAQAGSAVFQTPFGSVPLCLADRDPAESARGSVYVGKDTATLTVTQGVLLLESAQNPQTLSAGRVLVLTDAGGNEPLPTISGPRQASLNPGAAWTFGTVSALAGGGLILAGISGGGEDDSKEVSPH